MIYLIQDRDYLKIGYSSNIDQRKKAYDTTNCYAKMIMIKKMVLEKMKLSYINFVNNDIIKMNDFIITMK